MTDQPVTKAQLDALERAADKVFSKLGIDIEFTHHFLDRVNDERNHKQITIKELGMLFAKEYKRWGKRIGKMPIDAEAVMKDLSSEINIPFVLNKDKKKKDLVAKTVMRKKNFHSPDPELPVESVNPSTPMSVAMRGNKNDPWKSHRHYQKILKAREAMKSPTRGSIHDVMSKVGLPPDLPTKAILDFVNEEMSEEKHGAKKGSQVKGKEPTPKTSKPSADGEQPHPMRGRLVGENLNREHIPLINQLRRQGWEVYHSRMNHRVMGAHRLEFSKGGNEFEVIGKNDYWELYRGPTLSGNGEEFDTLEDAFNAGAGISETAVQAAWESYQVDERIVDPRQAILMKALKYLDHKIKSGEHRQSIGGYAFDVGREVNLGQIGINAKDLAQLYREWKGDTTVTEGWMERNLYYLDEVINMEDEHSESKGQKQVNETKTERRKKAKK